MPEAWQEYFRFGDWQTSPYWQNRAHTRLRGVGVPTPLPSLEKGQRCQIHFVVAWAHYDEQIVAAWLAVDREASNILKGAGCF